MALQLCTTPGTVGVAAHIALEESGLAYETIKIDFATGEQVSDHYRKINPKMRVPALIVNGQVLSETPAILTCVAQMATPSVLDLPVEPLAFALVQSFNSYLASTVHVAHAHRMRGARWTDNADAQAALTAYVPVSMSGCFELIEKELLKGPWVHGEAFSISDPYLFALCQWLDGDGVDINQYPEVRAHHSRMLERESVQRVMGFC